MEDLNGSLAKYSLVPTTILLPALYSKLFCNECFNLNAEMPVNSVGLAGSSCIWRGNAILPIFSEQSNVPVSESIASSPIKTFNVLSCSASKTFPGSNATSVTSWLGFITKLSFNPKIWILPFLTFLVNERTYDV